MTRQKGTRNLSRRDFLGATLAGSIALVAEPAAAGLRRATSLRRASAVDSRIEVLLNERIGKIAPEIYGHFAEHLGGVIYDGVWVGEDSKVPNVMGIRKALIEALQRIKPPVIRWPG